MLVTINWIKKNYNKYNNLYWNGILPEIDFKINRSRKTWGYASYTYNRTKGTLKPTAITISNYYDSPEDVKITTLLHEMIHIYDYTMHPERFINRRYSKYNAHGSWFKSECARLSKFGWNIEKYVTAEEKTVSELSSRSKVLENNKLKYALVCVVVGSNGYNWFMKTSMPNAACVLKAIGNTRWDMTCGTVKDINFYRFDDERLAKINSCRERLCGWKYDNNKLLRRLEEIKATEIHDFSSEAAKVVRRMAA